MACASAARSEGPPEAPHRPWSHRAHSRPWSTWSPRNLSGTCNLGLAAPRLMESDSRRAREVRYVQSRLSHLPEALAVVAVPRTRRAGGAAVRLALRVWITKGKPVALVQTRARSQLQSGWRGQVIDERDRRLACSMTWVERVEGAIVGHDPTDLFCRATLRGEIHGVLENVEIRIATVFTTTKIRRVEKASTRNFARRFAIEIDGRARVERRTGKGFPCAVSIVFELRWQGSVGAGADTGDRWCDGWRAVRAGGPQSRLRVVDSGVISGDGTRLR
jgi:hypothetical protein